MTRLGVVLVVAFACGACGARSESLSGAPRVEQTTLEVTAQDPKSTVDPAEPLGSPTAVPAPSAELTTAEACPPSSAGGIDRVAALAIDGLESTTSGDVWSRACASVRSPDASAEPYIVSVKIGWMGTLHDYASLPGARPIVGLADQAYAFDDGRRIALRSGEIVVVVGRSGGTLSDTEVLARQVAEQLPE